MRTSLFLSSLFAASLVAGAALADDHHQVQFGRSHGDSVDKPYKAQRTESGRTGAASHAASSSRSMVQQKANERINCSNDAADCGASSRGATKSRDLGAPGAA